MGFIGRLERSSAGTLGAMGGVSHEGAKMQKECGKSLVAAFGPRREPVLRAAKGRSLWNKAPARFEISRDLIAKANPVVRLGFTFADMRSCGGKGANTFATVYGLFVFARHRRP